jgi:predicted PurR-regulated permease PerM
VNIAIPPPPSPDIRPLRPAFRRASNMRRDLKVIRACVIAVLVIAVLAGSVAAATVLAPTAIAIVLALVLAPVARALERCRLPAGVAAVLAVVVTVSLLVAAGMAMAPAANGWIASAPQMMQSMERKLRPLKRQIAVVDRLSQRITQTTPGGAAAAAAPASEPILVSAARVAPEIAAKIIYVTILTIFLLAWRHRYMVQLILLPQRFENRLRMARICRDVRLRVSSYLFTLTLINTGLVFVTAGAFYAAGIPDPLLWGVAFGLCNFIPVIGPTAVILGAALVGFAGADTIPGALAPPLILLAINTVEANLVQPWLLSRRIVISPPAIFLIAAILVWMWGAPAAIAAVPLLIFVHTISLHVPMLRPVALLLATETGKAETSRHRPTRLRVRLRRSDVHRAPLSQS